MPNHCVRNVSCILTSKILKNHSKIKQTHSKTYFLLVKKQKSNTYNGFVRKQKNTRKQLVLSVLGAFLYIKPMFFQCFRSTHKENQRFRSQKQQHTRKISGFEPKSNTTRGKSMFSSPKARKH